MNNIYSKVNIEGGNLTVSSTGTGYTTLFSLTNGASATKMLLHDNGEMYFDSGSTYQTVKHTSGRWDFPNTVGIGAPTITGLERAFIKGAGSTTGTFALKIQNSSDSDIIAVRDDRAVGIGTTNMFGNSGVGLFVSSQLYGDGFTYMGNFRLANNLLTGTLDASGFNGIITGIHQTILDGADAGNAIRLRVKGNSNTNLDVIQVYDSWNNPLMYVGGTGKVGIGTATPVHGIDIKNNTGLGVGSPDGNYGKIQIIPYFSAQTYSLLQFPDGEQVRVGGNSGADAGKFRFYKSSGEIRMAINHLTPDGTLHVKGAGATSGTYSLQVDNSSATVLQIRDDRQVAINPGPYNGAALNVTAYAGATYAMTLHKDDWQTIMAATNTGLVGVGLVPTGAKFHLKGDGSTSASYALRVDSLGVNNILSVRDDGYVGVGTASPTAPLTVVGNFASNYGNLSIDENGQGFSWISFMNGATRRGLVGFNGTQSDRKLFVISAGATTDLGLGVNDSFNTPIVQIYSANTVGVGTSGGYLPSARFQIKGAGDTLATKAFQIDTNSIQEVFTLRDDATFIFNNLENTPLYMKSIGDAGNSYNAYLRIGGPNSGSGPRFYVGDAGFGHWNFGTGNPFVSPIDGSGVLFKVGGNQGFEILTYGSQSTFFRFPTASGYNQTYSSYLDGGYAISAEYIKLFKGGTFDFIQIDNTNAGSGVGKVGIGTLGAMTNILATVHIKGNGSTSATNALKVDNGSNTNLLILRDDGGVIIGYNASTTLGSYNAIAVGASAIASGSESTAVGGGASATGNQSTAIGKQNSASGTLSTVLGNNSTASNTLAMALGSAVTASGNESLALGYLTTASGNMSIAIGTQSTATSTASLNLGAFSHSTSLYATSIGYNVRTTTGLQGAIVMGYGDTSSGQALSATTSNALHIGWDSNTPTVVIAKTANSYFNGTGNLGISTTSPTAKLDISGTTGYNQFRVRTSYTPTDSTDANGNVGDFSWDDDFVYIKTSLGWRRSGLSAF